MIQIIGPQLSQWDTGRSISVSGSNATEAHFANRGDSYAVIMELSNGEVKIPDYLLQTGKDLCVYLVSEGITQESKTLPVRKRERPENYVYEDDQRNYIYKLITDAQAATEAANQVAQDLLKAKENGEFDGKDADGAVKTVNGVEADENGNVQVDLSDYFTREEAEQVIEDLDIPSKAYVYEEAESVATKIVDETLGDISTALDHIIALQEELINGSGGVKTITFTITGEEYTATEGMTWAEWCASEYNTIGLYVDGNCIFTEGGEGVLCVYGGGDNPTPTDVIVAGTAFEFE